MALECWNCGENLDDLPRPITRHNACPKCFHELHCCRMCREYAPNETIQCRDERADPPTNKENANFCDFFRPVLGAYDGRAVRADAAHAKLDSLFDAPPGESSDATTDEASNPTEERDSAADAARKLDDLFR